MKELPVMLLVMMLAFFRADTPPTAATNSYSPHVPAGMGSSMLSSSTGRNGKSNPNNQTKKPRLVLQQPEKVMRIHDYYMHKLQVRFEF